MSLGKTTSLLLDSLEVGGRSMSLGKTTSLLLDSARQRELNLTVVHLGDKRAAAFTSLDNLAPDDLNGVCPGSMPSPHVPVALGDGGLHCEVPILPVHVVGPAPGVIS